MAYAKTVWNDNTPPDISAENLNKMEQGIYDAQFPDNGSTGQILVKTNDGTGWIDDPNSAEWGNITGQISEQTDLVSQLDTKITMPSGGTTGQVLTKTATGQAWDDVDGLPSGGTAGQVLTKNSSTSGDASWQDVDGLPAGGTAGQVLTKNSSTDGDASWQTSPSGGGGTWGYISGTLADQTDLVAALSAKANASNLATIESSTTASQAYSAGDHLVLNGQLYEVTADVASGETLVVGTNITARTVGEELTALNKSLMQGLGAKLLWSGDFTGSGSLTISGLSDWLIVGYTMYESLTNIEYLMIGTPSRGGQPYGVYDATSTTVAAYRFLVSGDTITVNSANRGLYFSSSTTYNNGNETHIRHIFGIIKKPQS